MSLAVLALGEIGRPSLGGVFFGASSAMAALAISFCLAGALLAYLGMVLIFVLGMNTVLNELVYKLMN